MQWCASKIRLMASAVLPANLFRKSAFVQCRERLAAAPLLRQTLSRAVLWGGEHRELPLDLQPTTRFDPTVFVRLYLPLFMYGASSEVEVTSGGGAVLRVPVAFRNRLRPGQFPYPFWHAADKWTAYQASRQLVFHLAPADASAAATVVQRSERPLADAFASTAPVLPPPFDGKWMWTDAEGRAQPTVTLFDGYYRRDNPQLAALDQSYRALAEEIRAQDCLSCHVPSNPDRMRPLTLLQTPAHAAGEARRVLNSVSNNKMPHAIWGDANPIPPGPARDRFLARAQAFVAAVDAAEAWERAR